MGQRAGKLHPTGFPVRRAAGLEQTYTVLRRLKNKGLVRHQNTVVTPLVTREEVIRAQGEELVRRAGGLPLFMTAFLSGRKLTAQEAEELKELIDEKMGEG